MAGKNGANDLRPWCISVPAAAPQPPACATSQSPLPTACPPPPTAEIPCVAAMDVKRDAGRRYDTLAAALGRMVIVNSMILLGIFLELNWKPRKPSKSLAGDCVVGKDAVDDKFLFSVFSFSCFFFSNTLAVCMKYGFLPRLRWGMRQRVSRVFIVAGVGVSLLFMVFGCVFGVTTLVFAAQIRFGRFDCASVIVRIITLILILVPAVIYICVCIVIFFVFTL